MILRIPPSRPMHRKVAGHDKHLCPARAVVQLDPLHIRPPPAVGSSCTTALHTHPAHARRGPGCTHHPPRAANSRRRCVTAVARRFRRRRRWSRQPPRQERLREFAALPPDAAAPAHVATRRLWHVNLGAQLNKVGQRLGYRNRDRHFIAVKYSVT
jgi:hypothetical protein